ncbi:MAG: hypothetical protein RLZZ546_3026 [Bacteroidota bacterium]
MSLNCAPSDLLVFTPVTLNSWNNQKIKHLYRRAGFGIAPQILKGQLIKSPSQVVEEIINRAKTLPLSPKPSWSEWTVKDYSSNEQERNMQIISQITDFAYNWVGNMKNNGLRDKLVLFWHNHFVTKIDKYICPSWLYKYHNVLEKNAIGNFKTFVREIGITPAMLVFLDNVQNTKFSINENYARELFELFTLGVDNNYTQSDIVNTARAITGYNGITADTFCGNIAFLPFSWDSEDKTIFGKKGKWDYDDVIDILFEERAEEISIFICKKLYKYFVNPDADDIVVAELAAQLRKDNFELAPMLTTLFKSKHFMDEATIGTIIPGHLEFFITFLNEMGYDDIKELNQFIYYGCQEFNQALMQPTDVSGWEGNRSWITSNSLPFRWEAITNLMIYHFVKSGNNFDKLKNFALEILPDPNETDPSKVARVIIDFVLPNKLQFEKDYEDAILAFKAEVPENYYQSNQWNMYWEYAPAQVYLLLVHLSTLPEFQLS